MFLNKKNKSGFTLIEISIVLIIIGVLIAALTIPLAAQLDIRRLQETRKTLEDAKEAVIGFALANGRLPCGAGAVITQGKERFNATRCSWAFTDFLPGTTLGMSTNNYGFVVDGWGNWLRYIPNPYFVCNPTQNQNCQNTIKNQFAIPNANLDTVLSICPLATADFAGGPVRATRDIRCKNAAGNDVTLANSIAFIIISMGKDNLDASVQLNAAGAFDANQQSLAVLQLPAGAALTKGVVNATQNTISNNVNNVPPVWNNQDLVYDDVLISVSYYELFARMAAAGKLP